VGCVDTHPADPPDSAPDAGDHVEPLGDPAALGEDGSGEDGEDQPTVLSDGTPSGDGTDLGPDPLRFNNWRRRSTAGVLMTGIAVGLQKALELPKQQPAYVMEASDEPDPDGPIQLKFDPDNPAATVAIIRRPAEADE
jgi:hypothetical protein